MGANLKMLLSDAPLYSGQCFFRLEVRGDRLGVGSALAFALSEPWPVCYVVPGGRLLGLAHNFSFPSESSATTISVSAIHGIRACTVLLTIGTQDVSIEQKPFVSITVGFAVVFKRSLVNSGSFPQLHN